jgi:hypothetical protein
MAFYEEGLYDCEIRSQVFAQNAKGTEYFGLSIFPKDRLKDDQRISQDGPYERTVCLWTNSPENVERTVKQLKDTLNWDGTGGFSGLCPDAKGHCSFVGTMVELRCFHNEGTDGKVYDHFQFPRLSAGSRSPENDSEIAKRLDRLYKTGTKTKKDRASDPVNEEVPF